MRVIIAGSRDFTNYEKLVESLDIILKPFSDIEIVSGGAKGADSLGEKYAEDNGIKINRYPAEWSIYGKTAGHVRNKAMAHHADMLVAFWDLKSKGTKDMISLAKKRELEVVVIGINDPNILF